MVIVIENYIKQRFKVILTVFTFIFKFFSFSIVIFIRPLK